MPSELMLRLYHGDRNGAQALARDGAPLDVFEAAALGALEAVIERCEDDPRAWRIRRRVCPIARG